jgi:dephospho-CoA kinase
MSLIVITGGIGAGKSTVLKCLEKLGAKCVDTDVLAHQLYEPGTPLLAEILAHFGDDLKKEDGSLDRRLLGRKIFADPRERQWLEQRMHPAIRESLGLQEKAAEPQPLFAAIPLWFESGWYRVRPAQAVVAVCCPPEIQWHRLLQRGWTPTEIRHRLDAQLPMEEKRRRADVVIDTTGSLDELQDKCSRLLLRWLP